jgi:carboxylate/amino acid/amine transporter
MPLLILATAIWAFSFSLIGQFLSGKVDPYFSAWMRTALALLIFIPLIWKDRKNWKQGCILGGIGAVQLGLMYLFYYQSFERLSVPEVLIFTIFTPLYVAAADDLLQKRIRARHLVTACLAVIAAAVIRWGQVQSGFWTGWMLIQACNACFAIGQVAYRKCNQSWEHRSLSKPSFGYFHAGAFLICSLSLLLMGSQKYPTTPEQWWVLIWLGVVASGIGYLLWNRGATQVDAGTLAAMNNALIPAGLLVNLTLWQQEVDWLRLTSGSAILLLALYWNHWMKRYDQKPDRC